MAVKLLDYEKKHIEMMITSPIEETFRVNAVKKEPWTTAFIEGMEPNAIFWDVGANVGSYALIAAALDHRVVAVEPAFFNASRLCENFALNNWLDRVVVINAAAGAGDGWTWLHYTDLRPGSASHELGDSRKRTHHKQQVRVWPLDMLAEQMGLSGPLYLKIDVDGGEKDVLAGAAELLNGPDLRGIMLEFRLEEEAEIFAALAQIGWKLAQRYDRRDGKPIGKIAYGDFRRA